MVRVIDVDHIDGLDAHRVQRDMIIAHGILGLLDELSGIAQRLGRPPDARDGLRRDLQRDRLLEDLQAAVADHVPHHGDGGRVADRRQVTGEVLRPDEHIHLRRPELAEILAVHEHQIHADRGGLRLQRVGDREKQRDTARAVVCADDGRQCVGRRRLLGFWPRVPMGHVEHALRGGGVELRHDVAHRHCLAGRGRVRPRLLGDRRAPGAHLAHDPVARGPVARRTRDARAELQRHLQIRQRCRAVEPGVRAQPQRIRTGTATRRRLLTRAGQQRTEDEKLQVGQHATNRHEKQGHWRK